MLSLALALLLNPVSPDRIRLLDGTPNQSKSFVCRDAPAIASRKVDAVWQASIAEGGEGYSFVVCSRAAYEALEKSGNWVEPNAAGVFGVGFKIRSPKNSDWFDGNGNIYGRPEREVSLHWNGFEVARKVSPVEFRGGEHRVHVRAESVCGGSEVTVEIDKSRVFDRYFIAGLRSYEGLAAIGGKTSEATTTLDVDKVKVGFTPQRGAPEPPQGVKAFDKVLNDAEHTSIVRDVDFPASTKGVGRVICTLTLDKTPKGLDPWDRCASIFLTDENGEKFEIVRYITPFSRAYTWRVDVTDYLPLLVGRKKMEVQCTTYSQGWLVSVDFDFYKGKLSPVPYRVEKLWSGWVAIGLKDRPESRFFKPMKLPMDRGLAKAKLRFYVTGHGMSPNSDNAAEFMPIKRTAWVNGKPYENLLWKEDVYLNACRPQGGTWKFDRSGWAPGDVVRPWDIDITSALRLGESNTFRYANAPWENKTPNEGFLAQHWVEAQVISYRK